jgi:CDP-glucose 4,6-dehydratase
LDNSFWQDKRVFVTGCTGFLGSWLTGALFDAGGEVIGLIRDQVPNSHLVRSGTVTKITSVEGDVDDYTLLERILAEYEVEIIFHLAAQTTVGIANRAPLSTFETNVRGTWLLLEAARRNPTVRGVILASSDKAYGDQPHLPYTEDSPLQGRHPYDVSKSCADLIGQAYAHTYGLPVAVTRCANLYGGGDLNWSRIVPDTIRSVLRGRRPVIRSDGTFKRDYLYVEDAVVAYMTLAEQLERPSVRGKGFNFGLDKPTTVLEIVETIIEVGGCQDLEPIVLNEAKNEITDQYLASGKAFEVLGWKPQHSLRDGLEKAVEWYRAFLSSN